MTSSFPHARTFAQVATVPFFIDGGDAYTSFGSIDGGFASSTMVTGLDGSDAVSTAGDDYDGDFLGAYTTYDGGAATTSMVDGVDGDGEFLILLGGPGAGRTAANPVTTGLLKTLVLHDGQTFASVGQSGLTGAISR